MKKKVKRRLNVFLDTNILFRYLTQGKQGCEEELLDNLDVLVQERLLRLIVPEIVELELYKHKKTFEEDVRKNAGEIKKNINTAEFWSEIRDIQKECLHLIDKAVTDKIKHFHNRFNKLNDLLKRKEVVRVDFSVEILLKTKKRLLKYGIPEKDQDAAIIESILESFHDSNRANEYLLFCSENHKDFAIKVGNNKKVRDFMLAPELCSILPETQYTISLKELLWFDKGISAYDCSEADENNLYDLYEEDFNSAEFCENKHESKQDNHEKTIEDEVKQHYENLSTCPVFGFLAEARSETITEIRNILSECRKMKSWDDRSEVKLAQWMYYIEENRLDLVNLYSVLKIKRSLEKYMEIHLTR